MEIKVNERIPYWLTEMIAAHNLQMVRFSKYCRSIEAAQNMPPTRWRNLTAECSQDVLSSDDSIHSNNRITINGGGRYGYKRSD
jgi:hypothetical protein